MLQPLDVLLLARILLPGCVQVRRRSLLAGAQQGVQLPAQVMFAGRPRCLGQPRSISSDIDVVQHFPAGCAVPVHAGQAAR